MKNTISNRSILILIASTFIPFLMMFTYTYVSMESRHKSDFMEVMTRFNENSSRRVIERPTQEIKLVINSILGQMTSEDIDNYISPKHTDLNSIVPAIVNSTIFFETSILSNKEGAYRVYPEGNSAELKIKERPWFPPTGKKDEVIFSKPYKSVLNTKHNDGMAVTASMNIFDAKSEFVGNIALDLDLHNLSSLLKGIQTPFNSRFKVVSYDGELIIYSNTKELFKRKIPNSWVNMATESEGHFFDSETKSYVFYKVYDNPEWIAFSVVDEAEYEARFSSEKYYFTLVSVACLISYMIIMFIFKLYFKQAITALYLNINGISLDKKSRSIEKVSETLSENRKRLEHAMHEAERDGLTDLFSRKKFDSDIREVFNAKNPFYFSIIDIDNFKAINDTFGHHMGDIVLKYISKAGSDLFHDIYRFGGEELVVIFESDDYYKIHTLLECWRKKVEQKQWREDGLNVTFSCGISAWHEGSTTDEIFEKADNRLYQAKKSGKNCIVGMSK